METTHRPARAGYRYWGSFLLACALLAPGLAAAQQSVGVSYTLEGCRNDGSVLLPNADGKFICDATTGGTYTSGNLFKGWNELDLVPHRATLQAGNSAPATQTFMFQIAGDNCKYATGTGFVCADNTEGAPGYDFVSNATLNVGMSDASCSAATNGGMFVLAPGIGGDDVSIGRNVTVTQKKNTTCVYDFYERLALGASLRKGSSLHASLVFPGGRKDVPLPVGQILAQSLRKDMSAVANATVSWDVTKNSDSSVANFGDVCSPDLPASVPATVHVVWTKVSTTTTGVVATAHVYANNPSAREILVSVEDIIYKGTDQSILPPLDTFSVTNVSVPAQTEALVMTHTVTLDPSAGAIGQSLNDVATATYMDPVTGTPIPGVATAQATAVIGTGTTDDSTATVGDSESITGNALTFSVPSPSPIGDFTNYTAGVHTVGPVDWQDVVTDSGSVTFNKSIYLSGPIVTSGVLSDTATLDTTSQSLSSLPVNINISSTASVALSVSKTIPAGYLTQAGDTLTAVLHVEPLNTDVTFKFVFGGPTTLSTSVGTQLAPAIYTVTEASQQFCDTANGCTANTLLTPSPSQITVDLSVPGSGDMTGHCSGSADMVNNFAPKGIRVQAQKITYPSITAADPDYLWTIHLSGPTACDDLVVGAGASFSTFQSGGSDCLLGDGHYVVTEVNRPGWIALDSACQFDVDNIFNDGQTYSCTFHNRRFAHATVFKTKSGVLDTSPTDSFEFQIRQGADLSHVGTILADGFANLLDNFGINFGIDLVPGNTYQFCEIVMPGWKTSLLNPFVPNGNDPLADSSVMCVNFTLGDGENRRFTVDNTPPVNPLSGRTIGFWKNWASCSSSFGKQHPILDQTLAAMDPTGVVLGQYFSLHAGDCQAAVYLLSKTATNGVKKAGDPIFNMVAQMVGVELNIARGDFACGKVVAALSAAQTILTNHHFTGLGYTGSISKSEQVTINNLATEFDNFNNDKPSACL